MRQIAGVFVFSFILVVQVEAASFDCSKSATKIEKLICGNEELSKLDEALSESYKNSLQRTDIKQKAIDSQRQWLKNVRNPCDAVDCVKTAYETRIKEIELMSSFGIVILSMPPGKETVSSVPTVQVAQPQNVPAISPKQEDAQIVKPLATQPCNKSSLPEIENIGKEEGIFLLIEAVKLNIKLQQYECVVLGVERAHGLIQTMSDGVKRAEWGFELKDVVLPIIRSNEMPVDEYEYRLIRAATQSVADDWSPIMQASEDERLNDTAFLGWISDHYRKESQNSEVSNRVAVYRKFYLIDLAMLRTNFTLPENRRWAESWRIHAFFNDTDKRRNYLSDMSELWPGLPEVARRDNQRKLLQGLLQVTAGHVMSGYDLLSPDEAKKNIGAIQNLLAYVPQEPIEWQTNLYFAEAYWQIGEKKLAHDYFEKARAIQAPHVSKGFQLYSMARYLCNRMVDRKFLQLCPYGIYSRDEMAALLDKLEEMAETDSVVKYKIEIVRSMRKSLSGGGMQ